MLLSLWLVEVPELATVLLRFILFYSLALKLSDPLHMLIQANGNIKLYTIHTSIYGLIVFPLTWILYKNGAPVWSTYIVAIIVRFSVPILRLYHLNRITNYQWKGYVYHVAVPSIIVLFMSFTPPLFISYFWKESILRFLFMCPFAIIWTASCCIIFGLTHHERVFVADKAKTALVTYIKRL